jgi:hypothetical protein
VILHFPLGQFKSSNGTGSAASNLTSLLGAGGTGGFNLYFVNDDTAPVASFDAAFDNFRVERIK